MNGGKCLDCGAETLIINRTIGFFGLSEVYSKWCLDCVGSHAAEGGFTPEEAVTIVKELAAEEAERYEQSKSKS